MNLKGIALKHGKREPMKLVDSATITAPLGIMGDWRGDGGPDRIRQVTLLSLEQWMEVCTVLNQNLPWETRRANLCISGLRFGPDNVGRLIYIGSDVELEVTGETTPCKRMDQLHPGLKQALAEENSLWPAGVTCRVIKGGPIHLGDYVGHSDI